MTGWRLGYGVCGIDRARRAPPDQLLELRERGHQVAAIEALREDAVDRMLAAFDERRKIIHAELNAIPGFGYVMPKRSTFPNTSGTGIDSRTLEHGSPTRALVSRARAPPSARVHSFSYANSADNIREGLRRVREHLENRIR